MVKKNNNHITLDGLAQMVSRGFSDMEKRMATKDDLKAFVTKDDLKAFATKDDLKELTEEMTVMHGDVRYIRRTVEAVAHSDIAHEAAILDLNSRVHRLERKVGIAKQL